MTTNLIIANGTAEAISGFLPFILIIVIFYFLLIRPQRKQQKELQEKQNAMKTGDKVITAGGIHGIVRDVDDKTVKVEVAAGVLIKFEKASIVSFVSKEN
ncbi:MAG: preprotein translocase subunit YajC [Akkermansia sp.]|nr:preprotein translocase subunit YajC [Akkermansiaceae bacterium]MBQ4594703.1 preprotein translocase subunit YajC [Akkermansia sp.]MBQ4636148.1 preprotein translocase subunit YajC [Akkermansia sp.]MBR1996978.1 preprotein translocase subunit YajC [Akkermansia sp.]MBR3695770.1 preprotein translocase subunit YajC [Akkermansia sp.]